MRTLIAAALAAPLALAVQAGAMRPYAPTRWIGESVPVSALRSGATLTADFTDPAAREIRFFLRFYGADGKTVGDASARPDMPPLTKSRRGKPFHYVAEVIPAHIPTNAVTARPLAVVGERNRASETFDLRDVTVAGKTMPVSDKTANWIAVGEEIAFTGIPPPGKTALRGVVTDASGAVVADTRAPGAAWRWRAERPGYYEVAFDWLDAEGGATRAADSFTACDFRTDPDGVWRAHRVKTFPRDRQAIAVSARGPVEPTEASPTFGFHLAVNARNEFYRKTQYDLVKRLGMSAFLRVHWIGWYEIERTRGTYDWRIVDESFAAAEAQGYPLSRLVVGVFGTPTWNTTAKDLSFGPFKGPHMYAPKDLAPWRAFIAATVRRYPKLETLEIWNEPHLPGFSVFWRDSSPEQFVDLLRTAYEAAKGEKDSLQVMMGGIGMRYLPFYERIVALGATRWFDSLGTHGGYDMRAFRACETRYGAPHKPYFENEWHTVLYNCTNPNRPDEDACSYMMLRNLANLLHEGNDHVTGFGLVCRDHEPEAADFFAAAGGIQQIYGLFRSRPFLEPRRAAVALRTATDRFRGPVRKVGSWCFGEDGAQRASVFTSDAGDVAFVWNENARRPAWTRELTAALGGLVDWQGRATALDRIPPKQVAFATRVDRRALAAHGVALDRLDFTNYSCQRTETVEEAAYGTADHPSRVTLTNGAFGCSFALTPTAGDLALELAADTPLKEVRFALDVEGKGELDDVVELVLARDGTLVKPRTPALRGDIPPDFSPAGARLTKSRATWSDDARTVRASLAASDLYPFIYAPGKRLRAYLAPTAADGRGATWGGGWGRVKRPAAFGRLHPSGGGRRVADLASVRNPFGKATLTHANGSVSAKPVSAEAGAGVALNLRNIVPGSRLTLRGTVRGQGTLDIVLWARSANGKIFQRLNGAKLTLGETPQTFERTFDLPEGAGGADLALFTWQDARATFTLEDLAVVNE